MLDKFNKHLLKVTIGGFMKLKNKIIYIIIIFIIFFLILSVKSYAGTQEWRSLNYDVIVNSDGSMNVTETWNIYISYTNTIFKDFIIDNSKYSDITNVKVTEIIDNEEIPLEQIYEEQYHVDDRCYYALPIKGNTMFEIAWNVGLDDSIGTKTYKLCYTIKDAVKIYNDCTELYWMFLDKSNGIRGENITGTIKLPNSVSNIEKLRVWAHGPLSGTINRVSTDTVSFVLPSLPTNTMLEIRILTEENVYPYSNNNINLEMLPKILKEEKKWANKDNFKRNIDKIAYGITGIILIVMIWIYYKRISKYKKIKEELLSQSDKFKDLKYYRDIPNEETATPARAVYLYDLKGNSCRMGRYENNIITATMLSLALKGLIGFEPENENELKIIFYENKEAKLVGEEIEIYNILMKAYRYTNTDTDRVYITTKELSRYININYKEFCRIVTNFEDSSYNFERASGNIDIKKQELFLKLEPKQYSDTTINWFAIFIPFMFDIFSLQENLEKFYPICVTIIGLAILIGNYIHSKYINKILKKASILTENGMKEKSEWKALKRYMEDYSLLNEKEAPDIVLWEKYLVYATAFGISKKVINQLKTVHPEIFINQSENYNKYSYWNIVTDNRFGENSLSNLSNKIEDTYRNSLRSYNSEIASYVSRSYSSDSSNSSSGSGSGGGFSSGGGGRRWRRRLRRTLK